MFHSFVDKYTAANTLASYSHSFKCMCEEKKSLQLAQHFQVGVICDSKVKERTTYKRNLVIKVNKINLLYNKKKTNWEIL